ncbi:uncharacterized protein [Panulirus ornatus]|uniref:uncharacterized protein n=1 Tax=Panulirus ornatus TaxID=150431 RepID=UPI003A83C8BF
MINKVFLLLCLLTVAMADIRPLYTSGSSEESSESKEAKYDFKWAVEDDSSSNDFGHQEARDGDDTQGSYYVLLPDGRLQQVVFSIFGDDGYKPEITYVGEAFYPDSGESEESDESSESDESDESDESLEFIPPNANHF